MVKPITYGRMGNFLFQAAAAMAYAWDHQLEFTLPTESLRKKLYPVYLQHLVNPEWNPSLPEVYVRENGFAHQRLFFSEDWRDKNIVLDGYWQSEKYFAHYRRRLLDAWRLPWVHRPGVVSVHVRRGDYLKLSRKHPPVPRAWYDEAMAQFPGYRFIFFSDDIAWCKGAWGGQDHIEFSERRTEEEDLVLMSECEHHICSASTYSWWGAWLDENPNKRVIIPKLWFVPGWAGLDTKDIVPQSWERL